MRIGLVASLALHAAILAWAVASIGSQKPMEAAKIKRIEVEIVNISDLTRVKAGQHKPARKTPRAKPKNKPKPKIAEKVAKKVAALPPKAVEPKPRPKAKPKSKPVPVELKPKPKPKSKPKKKAKAKPKPKPKKKKKAVRRKKTPPVRRRKKSKFDADRIAALLNKIPDAKKSSGTPARKKRKTAKKKSRVEQGQADGAGKRLTISQFDFFMRQIGQCWNPPVGAADAAELIPVIRFNLKRNGTLDGVPSVVNWRASPFYQAAADAAIRAVIACQPYNLPQDKYSDWARNEVTFDPKAMFGG